MALIELGSIVQWSEEAGASQRRSQGSSRERGDEQGEDCRQVAQTSEVSKNLRGLGCGFVPQFL